MIDKHGRFEQHNEMIHCERIPQAAVGEKAVGVRMKTERRLGGCCGGPGKRQW